MSRRTVNVEALTKVTRQVLVSLLEERAADWEHRRRQTSLACVGNPPGTEVEEGRRPFNYKRWNIIQYTKFKSMSFEYEAHRLAINLQRRAAIGVPPSFLFIPLNTGRLKECVLPNSEMSMRWNKRPKPPPNVPRS